MLDKFTNTTISIEMPNEYTINLIDVFTYPTGTVFRDNEGKKYILAESENKGKLLMTSDFKSLDLNEEMITKLLKPIIDKKFNLYTIDDLNKIYPDITKLKLSYHYREKNGSNFEIRLTDMTLEQILFTLAKVKTKSDIITLINEGKYFLVEDR